MKINKTKPIKKLMIFTIITVMIVSLFAVPAFATDDLQNLSTFFEPSTGVFYISTGGVDLATDIDGYYAVVLDYDIFARQAIGGGHSSQYIFDTDEVFGYDVLLLNDAYEIINVDYYAGVMYYNSDSEDFRSYTNSSQSIASGFLISNCAWVVLAFETYPPAFMGRANALETALFESNGVDPPRFVTITTTPITPDVPDDPTPPADGEEQGIFAVWSKITQWIVQGLASVSNAFFANGELTLLGYLCIIPLALGLAFLLIGIIQKFLRLRG